MYWPPTLPMEMALEGGDGGELAAGVGGRSSGAKCLGEERVVFLRWLKGSFDQNLNY